VRATRALGHPTVIRRYVFLEGMTRMESRYFEEPGRDESGYKIEDTYIHPSFVSRGSKINSFSVRRRVLSFGLPEGIKLVKNETAGILQRDILFTVDRKRAYGDYQPGFRPGCHRFAVVLYVSPMNIAVFRKTCAIVYTICCKL